MSIDVGFGGRVVRAYEDAGVAKMWEGEKREFDGFYFAPIYGLSGFFARP